MAVTAFYAACLTPLLVVLSLRVIGARRLAGTSLGDGGNEALRRRMRVQANFTEYVPMALVLMGLLESLQASAVLLHLLGVTLVAARLLHAFGVSQASEVFRFRVTGMALTFAVLGVSAGFCLVASLLGRSPV